MSPFSKKYLLPLVFATSLTLMVVAPIYTSAQSEPPIEPIIEGDSAAAIEVTQPVLEQPTEFIPTLPPPALEPTDEPVQPTEVIPPTTLPLLTVVPPVVEVLPTTVPETLPPLEPTLVVPTISPVLPTTAPVQPISQSITAPWHESFSVNSGWAGNGAWNYISDASQQLWFANTAGRIPDSSLELTQPLNLGGVAQPQLVLRQKGLLSDTDIVLVEVQIPGTGNWNVVDQQLGPSISADWAARYVDLSSYAGQVIQLRLHVLAVGPILPGQVSNGYWLDELTVQQYVQPPAPPTATEAIPVQPTVVASPTAVPVLPTVVTLAPPTATLVPPTVTPLPQTVNLMSAGLAVQPLSAESVINGLNGQYYNNATLSGTPITRIDATVNFSWSSSAPMSGIGTDRFSVRWTGKVVPRYSETYTFSTLADDGVRLWVNGQQLVDNWVNQPPTTKTGTIALQAGQAYDVRVEYYEDYNGANVSLSWASPSQPKQVIPQSQLIASSSTAPVPPTATLVPPTATLIPPTATLIPPTATLVPPTATLAPSAGSVVNGLNGQYFNNATLSGRPITRIDPIVNFSWGSGAPISGIGTDRFSVRWTGKVVPRYSETYTFSALADDGVRLWVNGQQLVDNWVNQPPTTKTGTIVLQAGQAYDIRVEYYDNRNGATASLSWSSPRQATQVIPQSQLIASSSTAPVPPTATLVPPTATLIPPTATLIPPTATLIPPTATLVPPTTTLAPSAGSVVNGLNGQYYNNATLSGTPLTRIDATVNFSWGSGAPISGIGTDRFSVRWTGKVVPRYSETYTFSTLADDGVRLWVNGQQLVDNWVNQPPTTKTGTIALQAGQAYDIRVEYYDDYNGATSSLSWSSPSLPRQVIPQSQLIASSTVMDPVAPTPTPVLPIATVAPPTATLVPPTATLAPPTPQPPTAGLAWARPSLSSPITLDVPANQTTRVVMQMDTTKDYIIRMPATPLRAGLALVGGRNVVMIGGEINIPWQSSGTIASRTMLLIRGATGIVHIEGLKGGGADISEGIQIDAENAIVQLQNIRIDNIHARDQVGFTDNHPDLIQTYGNVRELRVDRFTGSSDYQGVLLKADYNGAHGTVTIRRMNIIGLPTARYLWWANTQSGAGRVTLDNVWVDVPTQRSGGLGRSVWPDINGTSPNRATVQRDASGVEYATWPTAMVPQIVGQVNEGLPLGGDFVPANSVGIGYTG